MLLTTEAVTTVEMATTIVRWYSYRWRVEEYHKMLKSGTQVERYRLAADGMKTLLGFLRTTAEIKSIFITPLSTYQHQLSRQKVVASFTGGYLQWSLRRDFILVAILSVIAVELLQLTYLHRTQPQAPVEVILNPTQIVVLKSKSFKHPKVLTIAWALEALARLGGYLEHRRQTPIGIQVLWRGWLKLQDLCEGWQIAQT